MRRLSGRWLSGRGAAEAGRCRCDEQMLADLAQLGFSLCTLRLGETGAARCRAVGVKVEQWQARMERVGAARGLMREHGGCVCGAGRSGRGDELVREGEAKATRLTCELWRGGSYEADVSWVCSSGDAARRRWLRFANGKWENGNEKRETGNGQTEMGNGT